MRGWVPHENRDVRGVLRVDKPQVVVLDGVLSASECDRIISYGRPKLAISTVVDPDPLPQPELGGDPAQRPGPAVRVHQQPGAARPVLSRWVDC